MISLASSTVLFGKISSTNFSNSFYYGISNIGQLILDFASGHLKSYVKGAYDFVVKPLDLNELTEIVHKAADQHELLKMYQAMSASGRQDRDVGNLRGVTVMSGDPA